MSGSLSLAGRKIAIHWPEGSSAGANSVGRANIVALREYLIGEVTQDYADGLLTRREAMRRLGLLALTASVAAAMLAACGNEDGSGPAAREPTASRTGGTGATTATGEAEIVRFTGPGGELQAAWAAPPEPRAAVLVIHENRGLTPHFHDLVGRLAAEGYGALCVDLLSAQGGTGALTDPLRRPLRWPMPPLTGCSVTFARVSMSWRAAFLS